MLRRLITAVAASRRPRASTLLVLAALAAPASFATTRALADESVKKDSVSDDAALAKAKLLEDEIVALAEKTSQCFVVIGGGSGVVVSADGYVLTNHHVAGSKPVGDTWRVKIPGKGILDAKVIGHDQVGDITLLKLEGAGPWAFVPVADSDEVKVGDFALALGNPFGFAKDSTPTVTVGVVSAVHRYQGGYSDAIQTDAPINPGNSGGPLLDRKGRLIGINGRIAVRHGTKINTGVGYAIPANQIMRFFEGFKKDGLVHHGYANGLLRVGNTKEGDGGAVVEVVAPGSEAERLGLKRGDIIVEADGRPVSHAARYLGIIGTIPAGETVALKVRRGAETFEVKIKIAARAGESSGAAARTNGAYLGVRMSVKDGAVVVDEVVDESPAALAGLRTGDVVTAIGRKSISNVNELLAELGKKKPGDKITLAVKRDGKARQITVTLGKKPGASEAPDAPKDPHHPDKKGEDEDDD